LALTSPTGGGRSVGIVRSRTEATEFFFLPHVYWKHFRPEDDQFVWSKHVVSNYKI